MSEFGFVTFVALHSDNIETHVHDMCEFETGNWSDDKANHVFFLIDHYGYIYAAGNAEHNDKGTEEAIYNALADHIKAQDVASELKLLWDERPVSIFSEARWEAGLC